jgi:ParB-like chromosome segregation protein Spo0J
MQTTKTIEELATSELVPYAKNSRKHDDQQVEGIAASIREFGFCNPVLIDESNGIIAGHGRVMAAKLLGLPSVPCFRLTHLTDTQKRAYVIADNKLQEVSGSWDETLLKAEVEALLAEDFDLQIIGIGEDEISDLLTNEPEEGGLEIPRMELQPYEKYDYLMFLFDDVQEFENACERFNIQKVMVQYTDKCKKVGLGRVLKGSQLLEALVK